MYHETETWRCSRARMLGWSRHLTSFAWSIWYDEAMINGKVTQVIVISKLRHFLPYYAYTFLLVSSSLFLQYLPHCLSWCSSTTEALLITFFTWPRLKVSLLYPECFIEKVYSQDLQVWEWPYEIYPLVTLTYILSLAGDSRQQLRDLLLKQK